MNIKMLPSRYTVGPSISSMRKSRLDNKLSLIPKPRCSGSTDRLSTEARRPSNTGYRSSSAEPARGTFGARLSREASATKLPYNARAHSQTADSRYGQSSMTPLRTSHNLRTTTPVRTPSGDRRCDWRSSIERALSFVTAKDQRPISNAAWQRSEYTRVVEALSQRRMSGNTALVRPLTITQFVNIVGYLLGAILKDAKLNNDNYVTKLPHLCKRLLYPGTMSKSWLKTVNTLHAFPQALALIAYLLDLANHLELPVMDEWLYVNKDEKAQLLRDYLIKCWVRFQDPQYHFDDLNEEHLETLKVVLKYDENEHLQLQRDVEEHQANYNQAEEEDREGQMRESRRAERRDAIIAELRTLHSSGCSVRTETEANTAHICNANIAIKNLDVAIEKASGELQEIQEELEHQSVTLSQREELINELDYTKRVVESKRALAEQISKMVVSKEIELGFWQNRTLDNCLEYKQGLIHLSSQFPALGKLAIDEAELRSAECAAKVTAALEALRDTETQLVAQKTDQARAKIATINQRDVLLKESHTKISEVKASIEREQQTAETELSKETAEEKAWAEERAELRARLDQLETYLQENDDHSSELQFWEEQDVAWRTRLAELNKYIESQKVLTKQLMQSGLRKRMELVHSTIRLWNEKIQ